MFNNKSKPTKIKLTTQEAQEATMLMKTRDELIQESRKVQVSLDAVIAHLKTIETRILHNHKLKLNKKYRLSGTFPDDVFIERI